jgi:hypothetical protein
MSGVIEGACRHPGRRPHGHHRRQMGLDSAQAILWPRAIRANGDQPPWNSPPYAVALEEPHPREIAGSPLDLQLHPVG